MSADRIFLQRRVRDLDESPAYQPISRVRINAGEDGDGNPIIYEAGNTTGRTIEVDNPLIMDDVSGRTIAANILSAVQGYAYKPYQAGNAILDPAAEIGDAVSIDEVYSVLADIETIFSPLMSANIGAREDGSLDHEYPYESPTDRALARANAEMGKLKTEFIVEQGRVAWTISQIGSITDEGSILNRLTSVETTVDGINVLSQEQVAQISGVVVNNWAEANFTAEQINTRVSSYYDASGTAAGYYEDLTGPNGELDQRDAIITAAYESAINQSARSIEATVAGSETKYDLSQLPDGVSISIYGYGNPNGIVPAGGTNLNKYYLDQTTGKYYRSNGTSWVVQTGQLELITQQLRAALEVNANSISSLLTSSSEQGYAISSIEQRIDSISLSVSSSNGSTTFTLRDDSAILDTKTVNITVDSFNVVGPITAMSVAANATIESPAIYGGLFYGGTPYSPRGALQVGGQYGSYGDLTLYGGSNFHEVFKVMDYTGSTEFYAQGRLIGTYSYETNTFYAAAGMTWYFANANVILPS